MLPYIENVNDATAQVQFLKDFGSNKVQDGICLNLVIAWIYFYKQDVNKAPNLVWNEMKKPFNLKQIAQNHETYLESKKLGIGQLSIDDCVRLYKMEVNNAGPVLIMSAGQIPLFVPPSLRHSKTLLIIIDLSDENGRKNIASHAIGVIQHDNTIYMYDPNVGILTAPIQYETELLNKIQFIYETKWKNKITGREICIID